MRKDQYEIIFTRHALKRAFGRRIDPDLVEDTISTGKMLRFGKNRVKIFKRFRDKEIICIDEIRGHIIKIVSIASRVRR